MDLSDVPSGRVGATPGEWLLWRDPMGCAERIVPIVSPLSGLRHERDDFAIGKAVSIISGGRIVGLSAWTKTRTTPAEIEGWSADPRMQFGIRTGYLGGPRALVGIDIDLEDPLGLADEVVGIFERELGVPLPRRGRSNSTKVLIPVWLTRPLEGRWEHLFKKVQAIAHGPDRINEKGKTVKGERLWALEMLGDGNQFVAAGVHTSGVPYEWTWPEGELAIPVIAAEDLQRAWLRALEATGCVESDSGGGGTSAIRTRRASDANDPTIDMLWEAKLVVEEDSSGRLHVECPWADEHSTEGGALAAYIPRGVGGVMKSAWKCFHNSCADRGVMEYLDKVGLRKAAGEAIEALALSGMPLLEEGTETQSDGTPVVAKPLGWGLLKTNPRTRAFASHMGNVVKVLRDERLCGHHFVFDDFTQEVLVRSGDSFVPVTNQFLLGLRYQLSEVGVRGPNDMMYSFDPVTREAMSDALELAAYVNRADTAQLWLDSLPPWDGVPRVKKFFQKYANVEDCAYTDVVSTYLWTAMPMRIRSPGCQVDQMIVLVAPKGGEGKSSFVQLLAPKVEWCMDFDFREPAVDLARKMVGATVYCSEEIKGLRGGDADTIKAFTTKRIESWVPKYKERKIFYRRRGVFVGITNHVDFLPSDVGERRWLPVTVGKFELAAFRRDHAQLWAEGAVLAAAEGLPWEEAERMGIERQVDYQISDPWSQAVGEWWSKRAAEGALAGLRTDEITFTFNEVMTDALNLRIKDDQPRHSTRLSSILRARGFDRKVVGDSRIRVWYMPNRAKGK